MFFYDAQNLDAPWVHHDLPDWMVVSVCVSKHSGLAERAYVALSKNGDVEFTWPSGSHVEAIPGAGLKMARPPIYGYVNAIREIGSSLFACGSGGQVYQRQNGNWTDISGNLKIAVQTPDLMTGFSMDELGNRDFVGIDGFAANDLYVAGGNGEIYHYDGKGWVRCEVATDELLNWIRCGENGEVWACGFNGTVLRGNRVAGFASVSHFDDNMIHNSIALLGDKVFLASNEGLFRHVEDKAKLKKVDTGLALDDEDANIVDAADGVLWYFGYKLIAWYDGNRWTSVKHPDNS